MTRAEKIDEIIDTLKWLADRAKPEDIASSFAPEPFIDSVLVPELSISDSAHKKVNR